MDMVAKTIWIDDSISASVTDGEEIISEEVGMGDPRGEGEDGSYEFHCFRLPIYVDASV